ncbi:hypothetical protein GUJ93_ZPchr0012g21406 [Zizania palustris]|uniref:SAGA-associated factor 11 n=1 Tax=Zizania palustris TaxID=103762 RepID=A0A8J6BTQ4_ZIZPA|nr:hypothetical protein GUJ93_ZPchr0012g21406 [Zizania palustris]
MVTSPIPSTSTNATRLLGPLAAAAIAAAASCFPSPLLLLASVAYCSGEPARGGGAGWVGPDSTPTRFFWGSASSPKSFVPGFYYKMVCMSGHFKMASVLKLVTMENYATPDDLISDKGAAQILHKQLFDAHEPNLLDDDDMHIFGSKPMADPLDLVCCNTCKKPIKASQYAVHAERCSSGNVNPNDSMGMGVDDDCGTKKPPKKGRKIKLTSIGNRKVHIKVKAKSQHENKNNTNGFELDNGHVNKVQAIDTSADQRLKISANNAAVAIVPGCYHRDAPVPLATKVYHSQGNYQLRLKLGQLYRQSCSEHSGSYAIPNSSQENGLMVSHSSPRDDASSNVALKSFVPQTKSMDQLLASTPESCPVISQQVAASVPNLPQATKSRRADVESSQVKEEVARSRCCKESVRHSKNTGNKKTSPLIGSLLSVVLVALTLGTSQQLFTPPLKMEELPVNIEAAKALPFCPPMLPMT